MWTVGRLWQAFLVLVVAGCLASLFGPAERWWGVDLGASGSALFNLGLIGAMVLAGMKPGQLFPEDWAVAERRAWVGLVFTWVILLSFAKFLTTLAALEVVPRTLFEVPIRHLVIELTFPFIAWGVISGLLARGMGPIEQDERDLQLRNAADRAGDWGLTLTVIAGVVLLHNVSAERLAWWLAPMILANVLVGILILKALVESLALVTLYARARR
jgi:hypothetical protein